MTHPKTKPPENAYYSCNESGRVVERLLHLKFQSFPKGSPESFMTPHLKSIFISAALFLGLFQMAVAEDTLDVRSGVVSNLGSVYAATDDCHVTAKPKMIVRIPPKHGTVTFQWGNLKLGTDEKRCKGRTIKATAIIYTSEKGYKGPDFFSVRMQFESYENGTDKTSSDYPTTVNVK